MAAVDDGTRRPGRPRSERSHRAILDATTEMLGTQPLSAITIEEVARRAGVGKTTIYRRWRTKELLALAVVRDLAAGPMHVADLGDTRAELLALAHETMRSLTQTPVGPVIRALVERLPHDAELASEFHRQLIELRRQELDHLVERGIARGQVREDVPRTIAAELFAGPIFYRFLMAYDPLDDWFADALVDAVLSGLGR